jgi:hypothetical protein
VPEGENGVCERSRVRKGGKEVEGRGREYGIGAGEEGRRGRGVEGGSEKDKKVGKGRDD